MQNNATLIIILLFGTDVFGNAIWTHLEVGEFEVVSSAVLWQHKCITKIQFHV